MSRGGARPGAGRPSTGTVMVSVRLPKWLVDWLRAQPESQAGLIVDALRRRYKLKPPKP